MENRKQGYGHTAFYEFEDYNEYGLIFHSYWKNRFENRLKLKNGNGKGYGKRSSTTTSRTQQMDT
jgi:long-subunit fatty acid transport protein